MPKSKHRKTKKQKLLRLLKTKLNLQGAADAPQNEFQRLRQAESRFHARRAAKVVAVEQYDGYATVRNKMRVLAEDRGEWAGYPMLLQNEQLIVEPNYPRAKELMAAFEDPAKAAAEKEAMIGVTHRNTFWSTRSRCDITIFDDNGKLVFCKTPAMNNLTQQIRTLGCSDAWGIEQESNAIKTLAELLAHHQFKQYLLTGAFLERSRRSGLMYMFRKLRPTVAIDMTGESARVRCTLCMHPIAYYAESWAGAMCPTDDVIAHLMLMRGDEPMLWRRSNQHPAYRPEAGL